MFQGQAGGEAAEGGREETEGGGAAQGGGGEGTLRTSLEIRGCLLHVDVSMLITI